MPAALPDLAAVASALTTSGFACHALCAVCKTEGPGDGLRLLALGHAADEVVARHLIPPTAYTLLKVSPQRAGSERAAFQPFRLLNTCVGVTACVVCHTFDTTPLSTRRQATTTYRVTRQWRLLDLRDVCIGPPRGGGFVLRWRGSKDAFFAPVTGDDTPWRTLVAALVRTATSLGVQLPVSSGLDGLMRDFEAARAAQVEQATPVSTAVIAAQEPSLMSRYLEAAQRDGVHISARVMEEHLAAEQSLVPPPSRQPASPQPPQPPQRQQPQAQPQQQAQRQQQQHSPGPQAADVDATVEALIRDASALRSVLDTCRSNGGGEVCSDGAWRLPPREWGATTGDTLAVLCRSVASSNLALRRLIAGHLGVSTWRPRPRGGVRTLGGVEITSPRVAVWASLCGDSTELLDSARFPGFVDRLLEEEDDAGEEPASVDTVDSSDDGDEPPSEPPSEPQLEPMSTQRAAALDDLFNHLAVHAPQADASLNGWRLQPPPRSTNPFDVVIFPSPPAATPPATAPFVGQRVATRPAEEVQNCPPSSMRRSVECAVCLERQVDTVLLECGHAVACAPCAQVLLAHAGGTCPVCRAVITRTVRLYKA